MKKVCAALGSVRYTLRLVTGQFEKMMIGKSDRMRFSSVSTDAVDQVVSWICPYNFGFLRNNPHRARFEHLVDHPLLRSDNLHFDISGCDNTLVSLSRREPAEL